MIPLSNLFQPWYLHPVVVIDFETSGVDPATCMPVEVAAARVENGRVIARMAELINPGIPIPKEAQAIHGISDEMVTLALEPYEAIDRVLRAVMATGCIPVGYNGNRFDRVIMQRFMPSLTRLCQLHEWPWLDPLIAVRHVDRFASGKGRHKLSTVCERWKIPMDQAHRATADVIATAAVLFHTNIREALGDMTICEVLRRQAIRAQQQEREFEDWRAKQPPLETS